VYITYCTCITDKEKNRQELKSMNNHPMGTDKQLMNFYISAKLREKLDDLFYAKHHKSRSVLIQKSIFEILKKENIIPKDADEEDYI